MTDKQYDEIEEQVKQDLSDELPDNADDAATEAWWARVDEETRRRADAAEAEQEAEETAQFEQRCADDAKLQEAFSAIAEAAERRGFHSEFVKSGPTYRTVCRDFASRYLILCDASGTTIAKIRVADHAQPEGYDGGFNVETQERHCRADISVAPGEDDFQDALDYIAAIELDEEGYAKAS